MKLFDHQKEAIDFILNNKGIGALFHEMGLGKTRTALEIFKKLRVNDPNLKMLVICPISLIESAWADDIKKFTSFTYRNCHGGKLKFTPGIDIYIINYDSFTQAKGYLAMDILLTQEQFFCVLDESSRIKNFKSQTFKNLNRLAPRMKHRIVMSGTPAPNTECEYWSQMHFIYPGHIFNVSYYGFRNTFFHLSRGSAIIENERCIPRKPGRNILAEGWKYQITDEKRSLLMSYMKPWCHYAKKAECLDLPDQLDEIRSIEMSAPQKAIYKSMKEDLLAEINGMPIVATVALTKIMKLRQITSGFAINPEGKATDLAQNPKFSELKDLIEDVGDNQAIIWCQFRHEIKKIKEYLGNRAICLYGETTDKQVPINKFKSGEVQFLIAHPRSAAHGLTMINASVEIFYSLDFSWETYEQARGRIHRAGQTKKCTYIHLICKDSIDEVILEALRKKKATDTLLYELIRS